MEMNTTNIDDGYPEAITRSMMQSLLRAEDYQALVGAGSLLEFHTILMDCGKDNYKEYINTMEDPEHLDVVDLKRRLQSKLKDEIEYIRLHAVWPLSGFIERMLDLYQVENIISIITGLKNNMNPALIRASMHPLGMFENLEDVF